MQTFTKKTPENPDVW